MKRNMNLNSTNMAELCCHETLCTRSETLSLLTTFTINGVHDHWFVPVATPTRQQHCSLAGGAVRKQEGR